VQKVVALGELQNEAQRIAKLIAAKAPLAIEACKRAIDEGLSLSTSEGLALEALHFGTLVNTEDFREGTSAFLEKRKPGWQGK
ncbi:MAG: enoyl-CoA hydratase-related protein, partial [Candidatus Eremiobacteraeota bacterium]|nr:enoyl-CoA hydratase-related protein [Candidatus Eremiobacteraeota bacterium]